MNDQRTYIVTGATGGIGRVIVKTLAQRGNCHIVMAVRNPQAAESLIAECQNVNCRIEALPLDLADLDSVERFARQIQEQGLEIDGLINNAGVMPNQTIVTKDGYELAMQVNYVATKLLTDNLLSTMRNDAAIVFTTSVTRYLGGSRQDWDAFSKSYHGVARRFKVYGLSKRLIAAYARELSIKVAPRDIKVNCADPGIVDTNMITMGNKIIDTMANVFFRPFISTPQQGAIPALRALDAVQSGRIFTKRHSRENTF